MTSRHSGKPPTNRPFEACFRAAFQRLKQGCTEEGVSLIELRAFHEESESWYKALLAWLHAIADIGHAILDIGNQIVRPLKRLKDSGSFNFYASFMPAIVPA